jgi:hypothetical protein
MVWRLNVAVTLHVNAKSAVGVHVTEVADNMHTLLSKMDVTTD